MIKQAVVFKGYEEHELLMKIEVLLATMFFESEKEWLLNNLNIQTDLIVGNQCDYVKDEEFKFKNNNVLVLSRNERGVGKNRNLCLYSSDADVVIFADNDVSYYDGYKQIINDYYATHADADVVIFNFVVKRGDELPHNNNYKNKKARFKDVTKFGSVAITAKRKSIVEKGIKFSLLFGGGAKYSCGEDSLFLGECFKKGLNVYLSSNTLGEVMNRESTWFHGITEKYVFDKGALFKALCPHFTALFIMRHVFKHRKMYKEYGNVFKSFSTMMKGVKDYKRTVKSER